MRRQQFYIVIIVGVILIISISICRQSQVLKLLTDSSSITGASSSSSSSSSLQNEYDYSSSNGSFNHNNPHAKNWCPSAKCFNSPACKPCNRRFLFIIATGRSGSTSLLSMFNKLPNVRLSGENYNMLFKSYPLFKTLDDNPMNFINNDTIDEGYFMHDNVEEGSFVHNAIPIGSFACVAQHLLSALNPPPFIIDKNDDDVNDDDIDDDDDDIDDDDDDDDDKEKNDEKTILGMKGIRLQNEDLLSWTPKEASKFLQDNFPCSRYIINIDSNYIHQSKTMKQNLKNKVHGLDRAQIQEKIKRENKFLTQLSFLLGRDDGNNSASAKLLDLAEWKNDVNILNDVVNWLGFEDCAFNTIMRENHNGYGHDNATQISLGDKCIYPHL